MERRLSAIFAADMVGYSRLMEANEVGTIERQKVHRGELIDPAIARHRGRIVKTTGDGLLAEFPSVVDAVQCAVTIQRAMAEREAGIEYEKRIQYRIGINLGDVILDDDDDDLYGDGVNIAARLEQLAEPGGICISGTTFDHLKSQVEVGYEPLGEIRIKNIERPVRAYKVAFDHSNVNANLSRRNFRRHAIRASAIGIIVSFVFGGGGWWWSKLPEHRPADPEKMAFEIPEKPSIAVLPFENLGDDQSQDYFTNGITQDLITDLSKMSGLFVIARNSVFAYQDKQVSTNEVAENLGVRYILEGSVQRAGEKVRINAQLIDSMTGGNVWANRYDGEIDDIFALQDNVTRQIATVLSVRLTQAEEEKVARHGTSSAEAYDNFLIGWEHYLRQTAAEFGTAIKHFELAVDIDPEYGEAFAGLAATYWQVSRRFWHAEFGYRTPHDARLKAEEMLEAASVNPTALQYQVATSIYSQQGWHEQALAAGAQAIGIDPNDADSYIALAGALSLAGNSDEALKLVGKGMRLNPYFPPHYLYQLGLAEFCSENFERAAAALEKATAINPDDRFSYRLLLATYGHLNQLDEIEIILEDAGLSWLGHDPLTVRATTFWFPFKEAADRERLVAGLRAANLPE